MTIIWRNIGGIVAGLIAYGVTEYLLGGLADRIMHPVDPLAWEPNAVGVAAAFLLPTMLSSLAAGWVAARIGGAFAAPVTGAILAVVYFLWFRAIFLAQSSQAGPVDPVLQVPEWMFYTFLSGPPLLLVMSVIGGWLARRRNTSLHKSEVTGAFS